MHLNAFYIIILILLPVLFPISQDIDNLSNHYKVIGTEESQLLESWGQPLFEEITDYGKLYYYNKDYATFNFSIANDVVIGLSMRLQPGENDASSLTFYTILRYKLENDNFTRFDSSYRIDDIKIDARTNNFITDIDIRDKYKFNNIVTVHIIPQ